MLVVFLWQIRLLGSKLLNHLKLKSQIQNHACPLTRAHVQVLLKNTFSKGLKLHTSVHSVLSMVVVDTHTMRRIAKIKISEIGLILIRGLVL